MSIQITLYNTDKRSNSTFIPSGSNANFTCNIKAPSSIINPTIEIVSDDPYFVRFNYAYIPSFSRYYYITDMMFDRGLWQINLAVDVLASYKSAIGILNRYILRSSYTYNEDIVDSLYPATGEVTISDVSSYLGYEYNGFNNGQFIMGVLGKDSVTASGIIYYLLTPNQFMTVIDSFYSSSGSSIWGNIAIGVINSLKNISEYVASCYWYPSAVNFTVDDNSGANYKLYLGSFDTGIYAPKVTSYASATASTWSQIPKHPQASSRGRYLNLAPFSNYRIQNFLTGTVEIPAELLLNFKYFRATIYVDVPTGNARIALQVSDKNDNSGVIKTIYYTVVDFGIRIALDGTTVNVAGMLSGGISTAASALTGNWLGAIASIGNTAMSAIPNPSSMVIGGNVISLNDSNVMLRGIFKNITDANNVFRGRPLCKKDDIYKYPGYLEIDSPSFEGVNATQAEKDMINSYMESGFFYE